MLSVSQPVGPQVPIDVTNGVYSWSRDGLQMVEDYEATGILGALQELQNEQNAAFADFRGFQSTLVNLCKSVFPLVRIPLEQLAEAMIRSQVVFSEDGKHMHQSVSFNIPQNLGGFRFPPLFRMTCKVDGVIRKMRAMKNHALAIYHAEVPTRRVRHSYAVIICLWYFRDEETFARLKAAEKELLRRSTEGQRSSLDGLTSNDCCLVIRRDMYLDESRSTALVDLWVLSSVTSKDPTSKHTYVAQKITEAEPEVVRDVNSRKEDNPEKADVWLAMTPVLGIGT